MDTYLPPKFSMNSFFVRHVAHPKRMKHISGLNNSQICAVNDVGYINYNGKIDAPNFPPNNYNEGLIRSDGFLSASTSSLSRRKEKAVPFNGIYQTFGMIDNTNKWRSELNSLASSVGLLTQTDLEEYKKKKEREHMIKQFKEQSRAKPTSSSTASGSSSTKLQPLSNKPGSKAALTSSSSNRLNEPVLTTRKTSRYSRGGGTSKGSLLASSNKKYIVEQADREAWMLQVLCQILQTDNLVDVQAWLVSASDTEKEKIKALIDHAMRGLEDSGRIEQNQQQQQHQEPESREAEPASTLGDIQKSLQKMDIGLNKFKQESQQIVPTSYREKTKLPNILKLDDDDSIQKKLEPIPESRSPVFNINMQSPSKQVGEGNAIIKLETPRKDFKVEQVKVSMLVKDDANGIQEINGDWTSDQ